MNRQFKATLTLTLFLVLTQAGFAAQQGPTIEYTVTVDRPQAHLFSVTMEIAGLQAAELDVSMPVWTPGSYLVREYERHVIGFAASDADGGSLDWRKLDKNTWRVSTNGTGHALIEYDVYAREPGIRWSFVYDEGGHVLGTNLFMHVVGGADLPARATFELPEGWRLDGGIAPSGAGPFVIEADSYHELIDTPMLIGGFSDIAFEVDGVPHLIAILGPHNADLERMRDDFTRIVEAAAELFGSGLPYDRYAFVFMTITGGGGIEHANGTSIGLRGIDFQSESYRAVLGVTSHEFIHAWVVKRIQPPAFRPYDYEEENYTDALWYYEGFTSYYGDRILHRAGLIDGLGNPVDLVTAYRSTPGHYVQSAADASFNAWIHLYRGDESTDNYRTNYYSKGRTIGNLLELEIAHATGGAKGLDDVMQLMWQRTRDDGAAYESSDIQAVCEEVAGGSFEEFFDKYVYGVEEIPFEEFFLLAGYRLVVDEEATAERDRAGYLGVRFGESGGPPRISGVVNGGPAARDGLNYNDLILAVDSVEVRSMNSLSTRLAGYEPGQQVEFLVSRFGEPRRIRVTLGVRSAPVYELVEVDGPTELQLAVRRRWRQM
jgi:predicted metalloprotease with PDZ domain